MCHSMGLNTFPCNGIANPVLPQGMAGHVPTHPYIASAHAWPPLHQHELVRVNLGDSSFGWLWGCPSLQAQPDPCSETLRGQCHAELSPLWCWGGMCSPELLMLTHSHPCGSHSSRDTHCSLLGSGCWKPPCLWDEAPSC